jgi:hypothetical protein
VQQRLTALVAEALPPHPPAWGFLCARTFCSLWNFCNSASFGMSLTERIPLESPASLPVAGLSLCIPDMESLRVRIADRDARQDVNSAGAISRAGPSRVHASRYRARALLG